MLAKIQDLLHEVEQMKATNAEELETLRLKYLSKKGAINALMADFRNVPADQKKEVGVKLNELKALTQERIDILKEQIIEQKTEKYDIDLTRTPYPIQLGTRHPLTIIKNNICDIFARLGFFVSSLNINSLS